MRYAMLRRDLRLFFRCLLPALALTAVFAALCVGAAGAVRPGAEGGYTPARAAVVDDEGSTLSRMLVQGVARTDYVSRLLEITSLGREEAMAALAAGELAAVIVLPEGFVDDIRTGREGVGQIWLSSAAAAHGEVVAGVASFGQLLLAAGQNGVFSGERLIGRHGLGEEFHQRFLTRANAALLAEAMGADGAYFTLEVTGHADTAMSADSWYAVSWLALLLMLSAVLFARLYTADLSRSTLCRLKGAGVGDGAFLAGKLLWPLLFVSALLAAGVGALSRWLPVAVTPLSVLGAAGCALVCAAVVGALLLCLEQGVPAAAAMAAAGLFLCGGIVPRQLLPGPVLTLGELTPFGAAQGLLRPLLGGSCPAHCAVAALIWVGLAPVCMCLRLRRLRVGGEDG